MKEMHHSSIRNIIIVSVALSTMSAGNVSAQGGWTDDGSVVRLTTSSDFVGINTLNPSSPLQVNGEIRVIGNTNTMFLRHNDGSWNQAKIRFGGDNWGAHCEIAGVQIAPGGTGTPTDGKLVFRTMDGSTMTNRMTILDNGYVGIGDTNPSTRLCVNGTIRAGEVIVTTQGWPDFVFTPGYALKPLGDVEDYIRENSRLEGIPSEKEVMANGVPMGEMQAKLLQKLEETTLYLIEMKKENEQLKARLSAIEQKVR